MKTKNIRRVCEFCSAEEGQPRPIGGYIVELRMKKINGRTKLVCQSCAYKQKYLRHQKTHEQVEKHNHNLRSVLDHLKNAATGLFT